jgi:hypothetical protein
MTHFPSQQALTRRSSCLKKLHAQWHMEMAWLCFACKCKSRVNFFLNAYIWERKLLKDLFDEKLAQSIRNVDDDGRMDDWFWWRQ